MPKAAPKVRRRKAARKTPKLDLSNIPVPEDGKSRAYFGKWRPIGPMIYFEKPITIWICHMTPEQWAALPDLRNQARRRK